MRCASAMELIHAGQRGRQGRQRERDLELRSLDASRAPAPLYLGDDVIVSNSALSGRALAAGGHATEGTSAAKAEDALYVTESGYEEVEDVRTRVGRNRTAATLVLIDLASRSQTVLPFDPLPGIDRPLAELRKAAGRTRWSASGAHRRDPSPPTVRVRR